MPFLEKLWSKHKKTSLTAEKPQGEVVKKPEESAPKKEQEIDPEKEAWLKELMTQAKNLTAFDLQGDFRVFLNYWNNLESPLILKKH